MYDKVYEPLTVAWFDEFDQPKRRVHLLANAPHRDLLPNLDELNSLLHELVDSSFETLGGRADSMLSLVREHRDHILWEGQMVPSTRASEREFKAAFGNKIKRNVSMGVVEIVTCIEGATTFCKHKLGLSGHEIARVLKRSGRLGASLGLLHDEQEQQRLQALTGETGPFKYPEITYADVVMGRRFRIPPEMFAAVDSGDRLSLKFVTTRVDPGPFETPVRRCPAFHFRNRIDPNLYLNDELWRLVIDIYELSRRFALP